jgi:hypothetical protein
MEIVRREFKFNFHAKEENIFQRKHWIYNEIITVYPHNMAILVCERKHFFFKISFFCLTQKNFHRYEKENCFLNNNFSSIKSFLNKTLPPFLKNNFCCINLNLFPLFLHCSQNRTSTFIRHIILSSSSSSYCFALVSNMKSKKKNKK